MSFNELKKFVTLYEIKSRFLRIWSFSSDFQSLTLRNVLRKEVRKNWFILTYSMQISISSR